MQIAPLLPAAALPPDPLRRHPCHCRKLGYDNKGTRFRSHARESVKDERKSRELEFRDGAAGMGGGWQAVLGCMTAGARTWRVNKGRCSSLSGIQLLNGC